MSSTDWFSLNSLAVQYSMAFTTITLIVSLCSCLSTLLSTVGQILIITIISWFLTKFYRKNFNKKFISSYKKAVIVTGTDTGFGNELAHKLNEHGFKVYATVLDPNSIGAKDLITSARFEGMTKVIRMDVTNDEEVNDVYQQIKTDLQKNGEELWAVVNNAGINTVSPIDWGTIDTYKKLFEVNTFGAVRVTRTFLPLIRKSKGRIVNLISIAGRNTGQNFVIYAMTKHAMVSFSDGLRRENEKFGIKVSTVEPSAYRTPMSTDKYCGVECDRQWNQTPDDIRQVYGEEFYKYLRIVIAKTTGTILEPSHKIYEVIDKLLDAIRNTEPEIVYEVIPYLSAKLTTWLLSFVPVEIYDQLYYTSIPKKLVPAVLKNQQ